MIKNPTTKVVGLPIKSYWGSKPNPVPSAKNCHTSNSKVLVEIATIQNLYFISAIRKAFGFYEECLIWTQVLRTFRCTIFLKTDREDRYKI